MLKQLKNIANTLKCILIKLCKVQDTLDELDTGGGSTDPPTTSVLIRNCSVITHDDGTGNTLSFVAPVGVGRVSAFGALLWSANTSVTVQRIGVGRYRLTHNCNNINAVGMITVEEGVNTRDSITPRIDTFNRTANSFDIHISEGDNGAAANTLRDRNFNFIIYA